MGPNEAGAKYVRKTGTKKVRALFDDAQTRQFFWHDRGSGDNGDNRGDIANGCDIKELCKSDTKHSHTDRQNQDGWQACLHLFTRWLRQEIQVFSSLAVHYVQRYRTRTFRSLSCKYAVTRETFFLTSHFWENGDVGEQGSTRDTT